MNPQLAIAIHAKNATKPAFDSVIADAHRAGSAIEAAGSRAVSGMSSAGFATSNLAAQFNDIGVMLASGQSPLLLAIQQGTQISQVLGPMKAGAAVEALKTALLSLVSPVSLITIGSIAAGAALVQWLAGARSDAESATDAFERHRKRIGEITSGYASAETAASAYFEALSRLPRSFATDQINGAFKQIGLEVESFRSDMESFSNDRLFAKFGSQATLSMQGLAGAFANGEISAEEFYRELDGVKNQLNLLEQAGASIPGSTRNMIEAWQEGAMKAIQFGNGIANLIAQSHILAGVAQDSDLAAFFEANSVDGALDALKSLTPELRTQQQIVEDTYRAALNNPALTDAGRDELSLAKDRALAAIAEATARRAVGSAAQQQAQAYAGVISGLDHELTLVGKSALEQEVLNNIRSANVALGSEEAEQIKQKTALLFEQNTAVEEAEKAQRALAEIWGQYGQIGKTAVRGVIDALADGKIEASEFSSILTRITDSALDMAISGLFGGGGIFNFAGGLFGNSLAGGPVRLGFNLPGFAEGGFVSGPGTSTSDSIPALLSRGEFVVNAESSSKFRGILEMMNAGVEFNGFSEGGLAAPGGDGCRGRVMEFAI